MPHLPPFALIIVILATLLIFFVYWESHFGPAKECRIDRKIAKLTKKIADIEAEFESVRSKNKRLSVADFNYLELLSEMKENYGRRIQKLRQRLESQSEGLVRKRNRSFLI